MRYEQSLNTKYARYAEQLKSNIIQKFMFLDSQVTDFLFSLPLKLNLNYKKIFNN